MPLARQQSLCRTSFSKKDSFSKSSNRLVLDFDCNTAYMYTNLSTTALVGYNVEWTLGAITGLLQRSLQRH